MSEKRESCACLQDNRPCDGTCTPETIVPENRHALLTVINGGQRGLDKGNLKDRLLERLSLEGQYFEFINILRYFRLLGGGESGEPGIPPFEKLKGAFTESELMIAANYKEPSLIIIPDTSLSSKIEAIDSRLNSVKRYSGFDITYHTDIDVSYSGFCDGKENPSLWNVAIAEGMPEMDIYEWDDPDMVLDKRIITAKKNRGNEKYVNPQIYAMLIMRAMRQGIPMDQITRTLFPGYSPDSNSPEYIPRAFRARWDAYCKAPVFDWAAPMSVDEKARFRPYVGGRLVR